MFQRKSIQPPTFLRTVALFVLICFTSTTVAWSAPSLSTAYSARRAEIPAYSLAEKITIPAELGSIKEIYSPPFGLDAASHMPSATPVIVHLEDAHGSVEAQLNQEKILRRLEEEYGLKTIFVEGGLGDLRPELLHFFKDSELNTKLIDKLTEVGLVGGVERFLSTESGVRSTAKENTAERRTPSTVRAYGVEDAPLYRQELELFRQVYDKKPESDKFLESLRRELLAQSAVSSNKELKTFFREWLFQEELQRDILSHLSFLQKSALEALALNLTDAREQYDWPQLVRFFKLQRLEKSTGNAERETVNEKENLFRWLIANNLEEFKAAFDSFVGVSHFPFSVSRAGDIRSQIERFYEAAAPKGFKFSDYPALSKRIGTMILGQEIQTEELLQEMERLNEKILEALAKTPEEKREVEQYREYLTLKKLLGLELTRREYQRLQGSLRGTDSGERITKSFGVSRSSFSVKAALEFYEIAQQREKAIFGNMLKTMKAHGEPNAVLVTGGFHSEGLAKAMKESGVSYVRVSPRISGKINDANYLRLMTLGHYGSAAQSAARFASMACDPESFDPATARFIRSELHHSMREIMGEIDSSNEWLSPGIRGEAPAIRSEVRGEKTKELERIGISQDPLVYPFDEQGKTQRNLVGRFVFGLATTKYKTGPVKAVVLYGKDGQFYPYPLPADRKWEQAQKDFEFDLEGQFPLPNTEFEVFMVAGNGSTFFFAVPDVLAGDFLRHLNARSEIRNNKSEGTTVAFTREEIDIYLKSLSTFDHPIFRSGHFQIPVHSYCELFGIDRSQPLTGTRLKKHFLELSRRAAAQELYPRDMWDDVSSVLRLFIQVYEALKALLEKNGGVIPPSDLTAEQSFPAPPVAFVPPQTFAGMALYIYLQTMESTQQELTLRLIAASALNQGWAPLSIDWLRPALLPEQRIRFLNTLDVFVLGQSPGFLKLAAEGHGNESKPEELPKAPVFSETKIRMIHEEWRANIKAMEEWKSDWRYSNLYRQPIENLVLFMKQLNTTRSEARALEKPEGSFAYTLDDKGRFAFAGNRTKINLGTKYARQRILLKPYYPGDPKERYEAMIGEEALGIVWRKEAKFVPHWLFRKTDDKGRFSIKDYDYPTVRFSLGARYGSQEIKLVPPEGKWEKGFIVLSAEGDPAASYNAEKNQLEIMDQNSRAEMRQTPADSKAEDRTPSRKLAPARDRSDLSEANEGKKGQSTLMLLAVMTAGAGSFLGYALGGIWVAMLTSAVFFLPLWHFTAGLPAFFNSGNWDLTQKIARSETAVWDRGLSLAAKVSRILKSSAVKTLSIIGLGILLAEWAVIAGGLQALEFLQGSMTAAGAYTLLLSLMVILTSFSVAEIALLSILVYFFPSAAQDKEPERVEDARLPTVTIQISIRGEPPETVVQTLKSATLTEYPSGKLKIQVIDNTDTVDKETGLPISKNAYERLLEALQAPGNRAFIDQFETRQGSGSLQILHREGTEGYKSGNLNYGLAQIQSDYILQLDADSIVTADTLVRVMPEFIHHQDRRRPGEPRLAFVQIALNVSNAFENALTLAMAKLHGIYERFLQPIRKHYRFISSTGHHMIFSREALRDAGGHPVDVGVGEDLDLAIGVQTFRDAEGNRKWVGKRIDYLRLSETVPQNFEALKIQRWRWSFGNTRVLVKRFWQIVKSPLKSSEKVAILMDLSSYVVGSLVVLATAAIPFVIVNGVAAAGTAIGYPKILSPAVMLSWAAAYGLFAAIIFKQLGSGKPRAAAETLKTFFSSMSVFFALAPTIASGAFWGLVKKSTAFKVTPRKDDHAGFRQILKLNWVGVFAGTLALAFIPFIDIKFGFTIPALLMGLSMIAWPFHALLGKLWGKAASLIRMFSGQIKSVGGFYSREGTIAGGWKVLGAGIVFAAAIVIRMWHLGQLGPWIDEATYINAGRDILEGFDSKAWGWISGWRYAYPVLSAWADSVHGSLYGARFVSVVLGTLTLFFSYLFSREALRDLFPDQTRAQREWKAILSLAALSISLPLIYVSQTAMYDALAYFFFSAALFMIAKIRKKINPVWLAAAGGVLCGAIVSKYIVIVTVPVLLALVLIKTGDRKIWSKYFSMPLAAAFGTFLVFFGGEMVAGIVAAPKGGWWVFKTLWGLTTYLGSHIGVYALLAAIGYLSIPKQRRAIAFWYSAILFSVIIYYGYDRHIQGLYKCISMGLIATGPMIGAGLSRIFSVRSRRPLLNRAAILSAVSAAAVLLSLFQSPRGEKSKFWEDYDLPGNWLRDHVPLITKKDIYTSRPQEVLYFARELRPYINRSIYPEDRTDLLAPYRGTILGLSDGELLTRIQNRDYGFVHLEPTFWYRDPNNPGLAEIIVKTLHRAGYVEVFHDNKKTKDRTRSDSKIFASPETFREMQMEPESVRQLAKAYGLFEPSPYSWTFTEGDVAWYQGQFIDEQTLREQFQAVRFIRRLAETTRFTIKGKNGKIDSSALIAWAEKLSSGEITEAEIATEFLNKAAKEAEADEMLSQASPESGGFDFSKTPELSQEDKGPQPFRGAELSQKTKTSSHSFFSADQFGVLTFGQSFDPSALTVISNSPVIGVTSLRKGFAAAQKQGQVLFQYTPDFGPTTVFHLRWGSFEPAQPATVQGISFNNDGNRLNFSSQEGVFYDIQATDDLVTQAWHTVQSDHSGGQGVTEWIDGSSSSARFYRVLAKGHALNGKPEDFTQGLTIALKGAPAQRVRFEMIDLKGKRAVYYFDLQNTFQNFTAGPDNAALLPPGFNFGRVAAWILLSEGNAEGVSGEITLIMRNPSGPQALVDPGKVEALAREYGLFQPSEYAWTFSPGDVAWFSGEEFIEEWLRKEFGAKQQIRDLAEKTGFRLEDEEGQLNSGALSYWAARLIFGDMTAEEIENEFREKSVRSEMRNYSPIGETGIFARLFARSLFGAFKESVTLRELEPEIYLEKKRWLPKLVALARSQSGDMVRIEAYPLFWFRIGLKISADIGGKEYLRVSYRSPHRNFFSNLIATRRYIDNRLESFKDAYREFLHRKGVEYASSGGRFDSLSRSGKEVDLGSWGSFVEGGIQDNPLWSQEPVHQGFVQHKVFQSTGRKPKWFLDRMEEQFKKAGVSPEAFRGGVGVCIGFGRSPEEITAIADRFKLEKIHGVEWLGPLVEQAARQLEKEGRSPEQFRLHHADAKNLKGVIPEGTAQLVTYFGPLSTDEQMAKSIAQTLAPGGFVMTTNPSQEFLSELKKYGKLLSGPQEKLFVLFQKAGTSSALPGSVRAEIRGEKEEVVYEGKKYSFRQLTHMLQDANQSSLALIIVGSMGVKKGKEFLDLLPLDLENLRSKVREHIRGMSGLMIEPLSNRFLRGEDFRAKFQGVFRIGIGDALEKSPVVFEIDPTKTGAPIMKIRIGDSETSEEIETDRVYTIAKQRIEGEEGEADFFTEVDVSGMSSGKHFSFVLSKEGVNSIIHVVDYGSTYGTVLDGEVDPETIDYKAKEEKMEQHRARIGQLLSDFSKNMKLDQTDPVEGKPLAHYKEALAEIAKAYILSAEFVELRDLRKKLVKDCLASNIVGHADDRREHALAVLKVFFQDDGVSIWLPALEVVTDLLPYAGRVDAFRHLLDALTEKRLKQIPAGLKRKIGRLLAGIEDVSPAQLSNFTLPVQLAQTQRIQLPEDAFKPGASSPTPRAMKTRRSEARKNVKADDNQMSLAGFPEQTALPVEIEDPEKMEWDLYHNNESVKEGVRRLGINVLEKDHSLFLSLSAGEGQKNPEMEFRAYQLMLAAHALSQDSLVILPTGLGKTNVAVLTAHRLLEKNPNMKIVMTAPTNVLVRQHFDTFQKYFPGVPVAEINSSMEPERRKALWESSRIIVVTNDLVAKSQSYAGSDVHWRIPIEDADYLIVDEVHMARGNHAMVEVMEKFRSKPHTGPSFMGLTATPDIPTEITGWLKRAGVDRRGVLVASWEDKWVSPYIFERRLEKHEVVFGAQTELLRVLQETVRTQPALHAKIEQAANTNTKEAWKELYQFLRDHSGVPEEAPSPWIVKSVFLLTLAAFRKEMARDHVKTDPQILGFLDWVDKTPPVSKEEEPLKKAFTQALGEELIFKMRLLFGHWREDGLEKLSVFLQKQKSLKMDGIDAGAGSEKLKKIPRELPQEVREYHQKLKNEKAWDEAHVFLHDYIYGYYFLWITQYFQTFLEQYGPAALVEAVHNLLTNEHERQSWDELALPLLRDSKVIRYTGWLEKETIEHPKVAKLLELLEQGKDISDYKGIVFVESVYMAERLQQAINERFGEGSAGLLIGKSTHTGSIEKVHMSPEAQAQTVDDFKKGKFKFLVATQVGEVGLDIPNVDQVVFFEPTSDHRRFIQRMGRTGRHKAGQVDILVTKGTLEEAKYWAAQNRMKKVQRWISFQQLYNPYSEFRRPLAGAAARSEARSGVNANEEKIGIATLNGWNLSIFRMIDQNKKIKRIMLNSVGNLSPGRMSDDLMAYSVDDELTGVFIDRMFQEQDFLRPLLNTFFTLHPEVRRIHSSVRNTALLSVLMRDYGFSPADDKYPVIWLKGKEQFYVPPEFKDLFFREGDTTWRNLIGLGKSKRVDSKDESFIPVPFGVPLTIRNEEKFRQAVEQRPVQIRLFPKPLPVLRSEIRAKGYQAKNTLGSEYGLKLIAGSEPVQAHLRRGQSIVLGKDWILDTGKFSYKDLPGGEELTAVLEAKRQNSKNEPQIFKVMEESSFSLEVPGGKIEISVQGVELSPDSLWIQIKAPAGTRIAIKDPAMQRRRHALYFLRAAWTAMFGLVVIGFFIAVRPMILSNGHESLFSQLQWHFAPSKTAHQKILKAAGNILRRLETNQAGIDTGQREKLIELLRSFVDRPHLKIAERKLSSPLRFNPDEGTLEADSVELESLSDEECELLVLRSLIEQFPEQVKRARFIRAWEKRYGPLSSSIDFWIAPGSSGDLARKTVKVAAAAGVENELEKIRILRAYAKELSAFREDPLNILSLEEATPDETLRYILFLKAQGIVPSSAKTVLPWVSYYEHETEKRISHSQDLYHSWVQKLLSDPVYYDFPLSEGEEDFSLPSDDAGGRKESSKKPAATRSETRGEEDSAVSKVQEELWQTLLTGSDEIVFKHERAAAFKKEPWREKLWQDLEGIEQRKNTGGDYTWVVEHANRDAMLMFLFGKDQGFQGPDFWSLILGVRFHDIGKLEIDAGFLNRSEPSYTPEEKIRISRHVSLGADTVSKVLEKRSGEGIPEEQKEKILRVVRFHHENWDGSGYPFKHNGEKLFPADLAFRLVDSFVALTEPGRPHKTRFGDLSSTEMLFQEALRKLRSGAGTVYDPAMAGNFEKFLIQKFSALALESKKRSLPEKGHNLWNLVDHALVGAVIGIGFAIAFVGAVREFIRAISKKSERSFPNTGGDEADDAKHRHPELTPKDKGEFVWNEGEKPGFVYRPDPGVSHTGKVRSELRNGPPEIEDVRKVEEIYQRLYDGNPGLKAMRFRKLEKQPFIASSLLHLSEIFAAVQKEIKGPVRFLDFGSGDGRVAVLASLFGWEADGVEYDPVLADFAEDTLDTLIPQVGLGAAHCIRLSHGDAYSQDLLRYNVIFVTDGDGLDLEKFQDFINQNARPGTLVLISHPKRDFPKFRPAKYLRMRHPVLFGPSEGQVLPVFPDKAPAMSSLTRTSQSSSGISSQTGFESSGSADLLKNPDYEFVLDYAGITFDRQSPMEKEGILTLEGRQDISRADRFKKWLLDLNRYSSASEVKIPGMRVNAEGLLYKTKDPQEPDALFEEILDREAAQAKVYLFLENGSQTVVIDMPSLILAIPVLSEETALQTQKSLEDIEGNSWAFPEKDLAIASLQKISKFYGEKPAFMTGAPVYYTQDGFLNVRGRLMSKNRVSNKFAALLESMELEAGFKTLDVGTGSGIFAALAAQKGSGQVTATDIDELSLELAKRNMRRLGLQDKVRVAYGDLFTGEAVGADERFDLILASLPLQHEDAVMKQLAIRFLKELPAHLERNGKALVFLYQGTMSRYARRRTDLTKIQDAAYEKIFQEILKPLGFAVRGVSNIAFYHQSDEDHIYTIFEIAVPSAPRSETRNDLTKNLSLKTTIQRRQVEIPAGVKTALIQATPVMRGAVLEAGQRMESWRKKLSAVKQHDKEDGSLVTEADLDVQAGILDGLEKNLDFPFQVVAEESEGPLGERIRQINSRNKNSPWTIVIDPIDGTTQFAKDPDSRHFGALLSLHYEGEIVAAFIMAPEYQLDDMSGREKGIGTLFEGSRADGQYRVHRVKGGEILSTAVIAPKGDRPLSETMGKTLVFHELDSQKFNTEGFRTQGDVIPSAGLMFALLAYGGVRNSEKKFKSRGDVAWDDDLAAYISESNKIWDVSAGIFFAELVGMAAINFESRGPVLPLRDETYDVSKPGEPIVSRFAVGSPAVLQKILQVRGGLIKEQLEKLAADPSTELNQIKIDEILKMIETESLKLKGEDVDIIKSENGVETVVGAIDRNIAHRYGLMHRVPTTFIITPDGKFLIQRRGPGIAEAGRLSLFGGHVKTGDGYRETVKHEIVEELQLPKDWKVDDTRLEVIRSEGAFSSPEWDKKNRERRSHYVYFSSVEEIEKIREKGHGLEQQLRNRGEAGYKEWLLEEQKKGKGLGEVWSVHEYTYDELMSLGPDQLSSDLLAPLLHDPANQDVLDFLKAAVQRSNPIRSKAMETSRFQKVEPEITAYDPAKVKVVLSVSGADEKDSAKQWFRADGVSRLFRDRVHGPLYVDQAGKPYDAHDSRVEQFKRTIPQFIHEYEAVHPEEEVVMALPNGNLGINDWFIGVADGKVYSSARDPVAGRVYDMLVTKEDGSLAVMSLQFMKKDGARGIFDEQGNPVSGVRHAVYGQRIIKNGKDNLENLHEQFDDLRHIFRLPFFRLMRDGVEQNIELGFTDDLGELYLNRELVREALLGHPITLSLAPLLEKGLTVEMIRKNYSEWEYADISEDPLKAVKSGEFRVSPDGRSIEIGLLPAVYPHSLIGIDKQGKILVGNTPAGDSKFKGLRLPDLIRDLIAQGAVDVFLWANGKDLAGTRNSRGTGLEAILLIRHRSEARGGEKEVRASKASDEEYVRIVQKVLNLLDAMKKHSGVARKIPLERLIERQKVAEQIRVARFGERGRFKAQNERIPEPLYIILGHLKRGSFYPKYENEIVEFIFEIGKFDPVLFEWTVQILMDDAAYQRKDPDEELKRQGYAAASLLKAMLVQSKRPQEDALVKLIRASTRNQGRLKKLFGELMRGYKDAAIGGALRDALNGITLDKKNRSELREVLSSEEQEVAVKTTQGVFRQSRVLAMGRAALNEVLADLMPAAYAMAAKEVDYGSFFQDLDTGYGTPVSIVFEKIPNLSSPLVQALTQFLAKNRFVKFYFVIQSASQADLLKFKKDFEETVFQKSKRTLPIHVANDAALIPELMKKGAMDRALIYDTRAEGEKALRGLEPELRRKNLFDQTMRVYDPSSEAQKPAALFATFREFFGQKKILTEVRSALEILSRNLEIQAIAQKTIEQAA